MHEGPVAKQLCACVRFDTRWLAQIYDIYELEY